MKTKTIIIRTQFNRIKLNQHLNRFFKLTKFNSHYVFIQVKITTDAGKKDFILGNKMVIDIRNSEQLKSFKSVVLRSFFKINQSNKAVKSDMLTFFYFETDKGTYDKFLSEATKVENVNLDSFS